MDGGEAEAVRVNTAPGRAAMEGGDADGHRASLTVDADAAGAPEYRGRKKTRSIFSAARKDGEAASAA